MILVYMFYGYLMVGAVFALWFVFFRVHHLDHGAENTPIGFKLLIIPGSILLWPYILSKILRK